MGDGPQLIGQSYQLYLRISEGGTPLPGPVAAVSGLPGADFHQVGCTGHQMAQPAQSQPEFEPYLVTYPFFPASSAYLRQRMFLQTLWTVELFFMQDNGGSLTPYFGVRLEDARLNQITTAASGTDLQETLSFSYGRIYWLDLVNNTSRGWDLVNNLAL